MCKVAGLPVEEVPEDALVIQGIAQFAFPFTPHHHEFSQNVRPVLHHAHTLLKEPKVY